MAGPLYGKKMQSKLIFLPFPAIWLAGLIILRSTTGSMAYSVLLTAWYFLLALLLLELRLVLADFRGGLWLAALCLLWGLQAGLLSPPLSLLVDRMDGACAKTLWAVLTLALLPPAFLTLAPQKEPPPRQILLPALAIAAPVCLWETARYSLSLYFLAAALGSVARELSKARREACKANSEAETLSELNRMKNQTYAELYHEMKTPLTVISVNAQLAAMNLETGRTDEEIVTDIKIISSEATRLAQMVTGLAGLDRLRSAGAGRSLLSLEELARTTARACQALCARYGRKMGSKRA